MKKPPEKSIYRFWGKVQKGHPNDCWEWSGSRFERGYGRIKISGKVRYSHRVSYAINIGDIPQGMCVLHRCDNPPCVNPNHLFIGTQANNISDMENKGRGRHPRGGSHGRAKLTEIDIPLIFLWQSRGYTFKKIAEAYDVNSYVIRSVIRGITWKHVSG